MELKSEVQQPEVVDSLMGFDGGMVGMVVMVAVCLNMALSAASKILDLIKDKTASSVDNKIADILHKVLSVLQKLIDFIGMNRAHK